MDGTQELVEREVPEGWTALQPDPDAAHENQTGDADRHVILRNGPQ